MSQPLKKRKAIVFVATLGVVVLLLVVTSLFIVQADEFHVVRQLGEIVRVIDEPGLNIKIPFVQSVSILPKHALLYDVPPAEINTLDKKRIIVDYYGVWQVTDPLLLIQNLRTLEGAEGRLSDIIYSNIRTELGRMNYDQIVNYKKAGRGNIDVVVTDSVNMVLTTNRFGIHLMDIKMKRADLPTDNEQSVFQRMISERESTAQQYLSEGDAEALKIRADTDRQVAEMLAIAKADAKIIEAEGEQEAARIYNQAYGQDPAFFRLYRSLESYRTTINDETVIVFPSDSPYLEFLLGR